MTNFAAASYYLPHQAPMVLIDNILQITDELAEATVEITKEGILAPFLNDQNQLPAWFVIEMMAQTIGVWRGQRAGNDIKLGLLLGVRGFTSKYPSYPLASVLKITVQLLLQDVRLASFDCQLTIAGEIVAQAKLTVYQPSDQEIKQLIK